MRTAITLKRLSILCAGAMLFASCADLSDRFSVPGQAVARSADDAYLLGRSHHLAHRYEDAIKSYRIALAADPQHVNARNGLATIYAERRAFAQAIPIWRSLTEKVTLASGPGSAYLFSNLGYAYFLNGEYESAVVALEKACLLDPMNHNAWYHLGESLQKLGHEQRAQEMFRQAEALQGHDLKADYAATGGTSVRAIEAAVKAPERGSDGWITNEIVTRPDGLLELRRVQPAAPAAKPVSVGPAAIASHLAPKAPAGIVPVAAIQAQPASAPADSVPIAPVQAQPAPAPAPADTAPMAAIKPLPEPAPATPPKTPEVAAVMQQAALLEIRNGNGVTGMARSLSQKMGDPKLKVVRLTNEKGFNVHQTRVEYQAGFRPAAERLALRFENATLVEVSNCKKTDMRLVIGRDIARPKFALRPLVEPVGGPVLADSGADAK